ncbi:MAG TPA: HAD family hydrolase [Anaerolineae bacterium]|nr:HAD family hydrolase [Anaerolineae bacterium]
MKPTTFLLDLDDTLIGNPMATFLPPYFKLLAWRLRPFLSDGTDLASLMAASVQAMQANEALDVTNLEAFMADFTRRIGYTGPELQVVINEFYAKDFLKLRQHVVYRPEAPQIVRYLLAAGYKVVIATNPLFPVTAIEQRLDWGGVKDFAYSLVTTMENSYFSKPNRRYYQAILDQIGSVPAETWMVGDDYDNDIVPAAALGIKTWWVTETVPSSETAPVYDKFGPLADFLIWLKHDLNPADETG